MSQIALDTVQVGILIIDAGSINGNNQILSANGADGVQCTAPGNPGGGYKIKIQKWH